MKHMYGLNQEFKVLLTILLLALIGVQTFAAKSDKSSPKNPNFQKPKILDTNIKSRIEPMSIVDSLTMNEGSASSFTKTTTQSWVSHTPIPADWLKPNSKFNELGILKVQDDTNQVRQIKPQEGLLIFKKKVSSLPLEQRNQFIEMGLNSNNPAIFDFSLESVISTRHRAAIDILSRLLQQKNPTNKMYNKIHKAHRQLTFYSLGHSSKAAYLQRIFLEDSPHTNQDLFLWAIEEFGNIANLDYLNTLVPLEKFPIFKKKIALTKIKLQLNSKFEDYLDRYIQATLNSEPSIREWGLTRIISINNIKAARFLLLLYEQTNIDHGLLEFEKIRETLEVHQSKFPNLYVNLLPKVNKAKSFEIIELAN
ncbi:MAG: hypothetical protein VX619_05300 [bacterium]|nr:hypothetical protein [bacterium]